MGVYEEEAVKYLSVKKEGTAREISRNTRIPISKVYYVLDNLIEKGCVEEEKIRTPSRYKRKNIKLFKFIKKPEQQKVRNRRTNLRIEFDNKLDRLEKNIIKVIKEEIQKSKEVLE